MASDPKTDLIYAILAMDSYNRGYGTGIRGLLDTTTSKIGNYTIYDSKRDAQAFAAGFYAIAYKNGTDTVIAYRGTDFNIGKDLALNSPQRGGSDATNGYGIALGGTATAQGVLAADFYRAVTGATTDKQSAMNTVLTGHSLGGGLAGYVGAVSGITVTVH